MGTEIHFVQGWAIEQFYVTLQWSNNFDILAFSYQVWATEYKNGLIFLFGILKASKSMFEVCPLKILLPGQIQKFQETRQDSAGKLAGSPGIFKFDLAARFRRMKLHMQGLESWTQEI